MLISGTTSASGDDESDSFIKPRMRKGLSKQSGLVSNHDETGSDSEGGQESRAKRYSKVQEKLASKVEVKLLAKTPSSGSKRPTLGGKSVSFIESGRNATALLSDTGNGSEDEEEGGGGNGRKGGEEDGTGDTLLKKEEIKGEGIV